MGISWMRRRVKVEKSSARVFEADANAIRGHAGVFDGDLALGLVVFDGVRQ